MNPDYLCGPEGLAELPKPELFSVYHPRKYREPETHYSPKVFGILAAKFADNFHRGVGDKHTVEVLTCAVIAKNKVPTYWVGEDLLDALLATKTPEMALSDMKWPTDGLLFMLPKFSKKHFKRQVAYIAMAKGETTTFSIPGTKKTITAEKSEKSAKEWMAIVSLVWHLDNRPDGSLVTHSPIRDSLTPKSLFTTSYDDSFIYDNFCLAEEPEHDKWLVDRLTHLAFQLLTLLSMRKDVVCPESVLIPSLIKGKGDHKETLRPTLWAPRWVGKYYRKPKKPDQGGSHASPETHLRNGHWRMQKHGVGRCETKQIWIEPVWVAVKEG